MKLELIKYKPMKEQRDSGNDCDLDESLIPYIHLIENVDSGEYTSCGMAISEYVTSNENNKKITCPHCLRKIKWYKKVIKELNKK